MCSEMSSSCLMHVITDQPQRYGSIEIIAEIFPIVGEGILSCLHGKKKCHEVFSKPGTELVAGDLGAEVLEGLGRSSRPRNSAGGSGTELVAGGLERVLRVWDGAGREGS